MFFIVIKVFYILSYSVFFRRENVIRDYLGGRERMKGKRWV